MFLLVFLSGSRSDGFVQQTNKGKNFFSYICTTAFKSRAYGQKEKKEEKIVVEPGEQPQVAATAATHCRRTVVPHPARRLVVGNLENHPLRPGPHREGRTGPHPGRPPLADALPHGIYHLVQPAMEAAQLGELRTVAQRNRGRGIAQRPICERPRREGYPGRHPRLHPQRI